jgi:pimeloyl-ACP methyl ester carboxylesterase
MYRVRNWLLLPGFLFLGGLLLLLRYILKTPQPLVSLLPGDDHFYKWTRGQIFYKVHGNIDAPPLLLLHTPGVGASAYEMLPIMERLAPHYRIYAPDLLGCGLSDAPAIDYNADIFVALWHDFLRDVVQQPATLLGCGLSCDYALAIAARSPELCSQLVLLSPGNHASTPTALHGWLSGMISRSPLLGTFLYALLTPRVILRQIVRCAGKPVGNDNLNYAFAVAHQLGAQYAALAFITRKLNLDVTLETPLQPALLLWNSPPPINSATLHYTNLLQARVIFLSDARYHIHESTPQNVASAILEWQDSRRKEILVAAGTKTAIRESATPVSKDTTPSEAESPPAVENSQPIDLKSEPVSAISPTPVTVEAFCVKCKQKRTMLDPHKIVTKNGRSAMEGRCPLCDTRLFRFVSG